MTNWKTLIGHEMGLQGETFEDVVECTLTEEELFCKYWLGVHLRRVEKNDQ